VLNVLLGEILHGIKIAGTVLLSNAVAVMVYAARKRQMAAQ